MEYEWYASVDDVYNMKISGPVESINSKKKKLAGFVCDFSSFSPHPKQIVGIQESW